jgi:EAL domain-containing protein (putative c-di-GMP-specific phosphodiesterase class I)
VFDNTEALKKVYLKRFAHEDLDHEIPFTLFLICVHDYNVIAESMGPQVADFFLRQVTLSLFDMNENISVFREEKNVLAVRMTNVSKKDAGNIKRHIEDRFRFPWRIATAETLLSADVLMVHCPDDIPDSKSFDTFLSRYDRLDPVKYSTLSISDLLAQDRDEQMLTAIRRALKDDSFQVYYQPIYSTSEKKIVAAEALIRLFDPEYGFISPEDMIKLAEREGYILEIGEKVFRAVCRFYSENHPEKLGIEYIEVNLSAVQCAKSKLAEQFIKIMKEYGIESKRINFEVTETAAMVTDSTVISNIHYFEKNGVKLSLDDFGTGYSNISYLYNIPFSIMKVDKAILWSADKNRKADLTLKNTFMMASKLGIKVVQEGVETEEQIKKLLAIGCDYFQGFYFSKPVSGKDFLAYVRDFKLPAVCKGSEEGRNGNDK